MASRKIQPASECCRVMALPPARGRSRAATRETPVGHHPRWLRYLLLLLTICTAHGCSVWGLANRTNLYEPLHYDLTPEESRELKLYCGWANDAWSYASESGADTEDYHDGFVSGFVDHVFAGGEGIPPAVPPRKFWRISRRTKESTANGLSEWTDGFRHGARVAMEGGYRDRVISPFASRLTFPDRLDEYRNQTRGAARTGDYLPETPGERRGIDASPEGLAIPNDAGEMIVAPEGVDHSDLSEIMDDDVQDLDAMEGAPKGPTIRLRDADEGLRDEDVNPFRDNEPGDREAMDRLRDKKMRLLDDELSSAKKRKGFGDYRDIIEASQGDGPSQAYAEAVAAADARRSGQKSPRKFDYSASNRQNRILRSHPIPRKNERVRQAGFSESSSEHEKYWGGSSSKTSRQLPTPVYGSLRAAQTDSDEESQTLKNRFRDLDHVDREIDYSGGIWDVEFQQQ